MMNKKFKYISYIDKNSIKAVIICGLVLFTSLISYSDVSNTPHNLNPPSASDAPGENKNQIGTCKFCHISHNAAPASPIWNRFDQGNVYKIYESSTLKAEVQQPNGASKLCLSCHDGTVALGNVRVGIEIQKNKELQRKIGGRFSLETDLSDDHPVSFVYDSTLAIENKFLTEPSALPTEIKIDSAKQLQCTSCHDPHTDKTPKFLTRFDQNSELCLTCHRIEFWDTTSHATSDKELRGVGSIVSELPFNTVSENGCYNCHDVHGAEHAERLLRSDTEEDNCYVCHDGSVTEVDIKGEFSNFSIHPIDITEWVHDPIENPLTMDTHVTCTDCHNPHSSEDDVPGITNSGSLTDRSAFEYQVCYKCHGVSNEPSTSIVRQDNISNIRFKLDSVNPSYHPVVDIGKNPNIIGLQADLTPSSTINCSDCHSPHGSGFDLLFTNDYQIPNGTPESAENYALCYSCHNRSTLLNDAGGFPHNRHVTELQTSCAVCHDAHGSRENAALINFMLADEEGLRIVGPSAESGILDFQKNGSTGTCFLTCHGSNHEPFEYRSRN